MARLDVRNLYFDWLCDKVCDPNTKKHYAMLLHQLLSIPFRYSLPMDGNRYEDGIDLRYRFGEEKNIPSSVISEEIDVTECSVLEMMIALCIRIEEHIMDDNELGDRTGFWFWGMIINLGLDGMSNTQIDPIYVYSCIDILLDRQYAPNGEGGLCTLHYNTHDLRNIDIWYQMMWYLDEAFEQGR